MKTVIITADDFGNSIPVNEAVERGHNEGILSAASLMVSGPAFDDAVRRARSMPRLGVGLHLTLVDGRSVLPPNQIPGLVDSSGRFHRSAERQGVALFFSPARRRQARAEIRAQFERFRSTGLTLDHVNGHKHFHIHPVVASEIAVLLKDYGRVPVRIPVEPAAASFKATGEGRLSCLWNEKFFRSQSWWLRRQLSRAGVPSTDWVFGLNKTGRMSAGDVAGYLKALPEGRTEIYLHPATRRWDGPDNLPSSYRPVEEFEALTDNRVLATLKQLEITPVPYLVAFGNEAHQRGQT